MKKLTVGISLLSLALASCGSGGDQPEQSPSATAGSEDPMAMSGPFAAAEMRMNAAMMAAVGITVGDSWVRKMIAHHRGAVEMSNLALAQTPTADVATMAREVVSKQTAEIADLEKLVAAGNPNPASAEPYRAAEAAMHETMMAAKGGDISETYLRKMLEHHKGAVAMSDVALAQGVTGAIRSSAEKVRADQQKEIAMVEAMLRGEPMGAAKAAPSPAVAPAARPAAPRATVSPKPSPTAAAKPKASPKPRPTPTAMPPGHDMDKM